MLAAGSNICSLVCRKPAHRRAMTSRVSLDASRLPPCGSTLASIHLRCHSAELTFVPPHGSQFFEFVTRAVIPFSASARSIRTARAVLGRAFVFAGVGRGSVECFRRGGVIGDRGLGIRYPTECCFYLWVHYHCIELCLPRSFSCVLLSLLRLPHRAIVIV